MKTKPFAGRARHSVRAVLCVLTDSGQRTPMHREQAARPTNKSVSICAPILQLRARTTKIWTAVVERSGDTAFCAAGFPKRRGASLPAAVQNLRLRRNRLGFIRG
jgi:hypothetical protein